jgi:hypothetical protein
MRRIQILPRTKNHDFPKASLAIQAALIPAGTTMAAQDFGRIKQNFKTSHKRPPGPSADNFF